MKYRTIDLKIDQFVSYANDNKINLIPPFQRGHAWKLPARKKLIANIVMGKPIPAIFLYREPSGDKYLYNILDGKQRMESLLLFIGNEHSSLKIDGIAKYFFEPRHRKDINFKIDLDGKKVGIKDLANDLFRDFREYVIPTIEITVDEDHATPLDEIISLFVDINSQGEKVTRFDIVKGMSQDPLLRQSFDLIARHETRGKDIFYKPKVNTLTSVLKRLQIVDKIKGGNARVDRMWELLVEMALFLRTNKHRAPSEILNSFIRDEKNKKLSVVEAQKLRGLFSFVQRCYKDGLIETKLATNQIHFYTMTTSIVADDLLQKLGEDELSARLIRFGKMIDQGKVPKSIKRHLASYLDLTERQTTHVKRRQERQVAFTKSILGMG